VLKLVSQPALAGPGFTGDQSESDAIRQGFVQCTPEFAELLLASNEVTKRKRPCILGHGAGMEKVDPVPAILLRAIECTVRALQECFQSGIKPCAFRHAN